MMVKQAMKCWNIETGSDLEEKLYVCFDRCPECRPRITDLQAHL
jgi:hypothetical protein